jgi:hypothetical protein
LTCPIFNGPRDAQIVTSVYKRVGVLWRDNPEDNPWGLAFLRMLDMATDSGLFHSNPQGDVLPLYEAKFAHHFDHRFATYEGATQAQLNKGTLPRLSREQHDNAQYAVLPHYWIDRIEVNERLARRGWDRGWLFGWRDIARSVDERTVISTVIPRSGVGDKYLLAFTESGAHLLQANMSSFILDYVVRQKFAGPSLKYFVIKQLPVLPPSAYADWANWIQDRVLELTYTAWDMSPFARDLGDDGPPFRWDEDRRFLLRAELDAAFFHLYGIDRDDVDYIMETFPIVKRKDEKDHGTYRTKAKILEIYDAMATAKQSDTEYQACLSPAPGQGPRHPARE